MASDVMFHCSQTTDELNFGILLKKTLKRKSHLPGLSTHRAYIMNIHLALIFNPFSVTSIILIPHFSNEQFYFRAVGFVRMAGAFPTM